MGFQRQEACFSDEMAEILASFACGTENPRGAIDRVTRGAISHLAEIESAAQEHLLGLSEGVVTTSAKEEQPEPD